MFQKIFIQEKLNNAWGFLLLAGLALVFGYLFAHQAALGFGVLGLAIGVFTMIICLMNTEVGLYITIGYSFFAFGLNRFLFNDSLQVGIGSDILLIVTFLSLFIVRKGPIKFPRSPIITCLLIMYAYITLQALNPYPQSLAGWGQTIRKIIAEFLLVFVSYNVFTSYAPVKRFLNVIFTLCLIAGVYGCIQQWHGLFDFEMAWVHADEHRFGLIFINGDYRKFSTMSDPTAFGIIMAAAAAFFAVLATREKSSGRRMLLIGGVLAMVLGMSFSGTRTANAMLIGGIVIFILLAINKRSTQVFAVFATFIFIVLLYGPYSNQTINRFRTTFLGSEDESFKVRQMNKAFIQPYILSHPFGGGMRTTGAGGLEYNPGHRLAGFPPDSGYLKYALETGWIGLAFLCILYFVIMRGTIKAYFAARDERFKIIYAGSAAFFFSLYVAQYAQDAIGQITDIVVYYPLLAITLRAETFEKNYKPEQQEEYAAT